MIYLASPYTHDDSEVREARYRAVSRVTVDLIKQGKFVYSPIAHSHPLLQFSNLPLEYDYWQKLCEDAIACCDYLIVLKLPGWETSKGVQAEIKFATEMNMLIEYMEYHDGISNAVSASA